MALSEICLNAGVSELARRVRGRTLSAQAVAQAFCDRVEALNPALNAIIDFDRVQVQNEAAAIDRRVSEGEVLPLAGVPFTVKDNLWVGGRRISQGSHLFEHFVAPRDAWTVARLRAAGAVMLGITNCSEFACKGVTTNRLYGATRHPLDARLTPGGSSGGAASATAAGLGMVALATDAGGSIRRPAAHCGLIGLKPSSGIVPHPWGFAEPNFGVSVVGLIARSAADCAAVFRELVAFDANDPAGVPIALDLGDGSVPAPHALRIAWSPRLGCDFAIDDDVLAAFEARIGALRAAGWPVTEVDPVWPEGTGAYPLLALQQAGLHALYGSRGAADLARLDPDILAQIEAGAAHAPDVIARTVRQRERIANSLASFFERFDLLIAPAAPVVAWDIDSYPHVIGGRPAGPRGHAAFTPLFNYCGVPACAVPAGMVRGLPVGLQVVGPRFEDLRVLQMVAQIEALA